MATTKSSSKTTWTPSYSQAGLICVLLIAIPLTTKLVNGYLLCSVTMTTSFLDLAVGIAMLVACGAFPLFGLALKWKPKSIPGRWCRYIALVLLGALLVGIFAFACCNFTLNLFSTIFSSQAARLDSEAKFDEFRIDQKLPNAKYLTKKCHPQQQKPCDGMCEMNYGWIWLILQLDQLDPLNVCAGNDNETIKAMFLRDRATFGLIHRTDVIFKVLVSIEWLAVTGGMACLLGLIVSNPSKPKQSDSAPTATNNSSEEEEKEDEDGSKPKEENSNQLV